MSHFNLRQAPWVSSTTVASVGIHHFIDPDHIYTLTEIFCSCDYLLNHAKVLENTQNSDYKSWCFKSSHCQYELNIGCYERWFWVGLHGLCTATVHCCEMLWQVAAPPRSFTSQFSALSWELILWVNPEARLMNKSLHKSIQYGSSTLMIPANDASSWRNITYSSCAVS